MNVIIEFLGRDTFIILVLYIGSNIRAGKPEKVPVVQGLILAFTPFFVLLCLIYIFEWGVGLLGLEIPTKAMGAMGGIGGYLGNSWLIGLSKNGKSIEEAGALQSLITLIKSTVNLKKTE